MISPNDLREAAICCRACGNTALYDRLINHAKAQEKIEKERKAPFNVDDRFKARLVLLLKEDKMAEAVKTLRDATKRSLGACHDFINSLKENISEHA